MAGAERNLRHCIYGQQNQTKLWGDIPVVLMFREDYQLLPVKDNGSIQRYAKRQGTITPHSTTASRKAQLLKEIGNSLLIVDMTQNVFTLTENYRAMEDPVFGNILKNCVKAPCLTQEPSVSRDNACTCKTTNQEKKSKTTLVRCGCKPVNSKKMRNIQKSS